MIMNNRFSLYIKRYFSLSEISKLPSHIKNFMQSVLAKPFMIICNGLFFDNHKVVFDNFSGKGYGGNSKFIADEIIKRKYNYRLIWLVNDKRDCNFPNQVIRVKKGSWRELYELATAKIWIDNVRKLSSIIKCKNQYYIQTWHGGGPCLKMVENDAAEHLSESYLRCAKHDSEMADLFISGCDWRSNNYRNAFWYNGEILCSGTPTSDILFNQTEEELRKTRESLGIPNNFRIALYAPTFRNDHGVKSYNLNYIDFVNSLQARFGGKWCVIVRLHPTLSSKGMNIDYNNIIINGSAHPQIEDLILISEVMVTDFSGCMFDAFRLKKIVFLYASDYESYIRNERKLYFDLTKLPSSLSKTNEELCESIKFHNQEIYDKKLRGFLDIIHYYPGGHAAEQIADKINNIIAS